MCKIRAKNTFKNIQTQNWLMFQIMEHALVPEDVGAYHYIKKLVAHIEIPICWSQSEIKWLEFPGKVVVIKTEHNLLLSNQIIYDMGIDLSALRIK